MHAHPIRLSYGAHTLLCVSEPSLHHVFNSNNNNNNTLIYIAPYDNLYATDSILLKYTKYVINNVFPLHSLET